MNKPGAWDPAPEIREGGDVLVFFARIGVFLVLLLIGYAVYVKVARAIFQPRLAVVGVIAPEEPWPTDTVVVVGLRVADHRWMDGAAYVVLSIEGETEIEGPVTMVPAREEADVTVAARLTPGSKVASLTLYDATRENARLDARHGVTFRIGRSDVRIDAIEYPTAVSRGDTISIAIHTLRYGGIADEYLVPIAVILNEEAEEIQETDGRSFLLEANAETATVILNVPTQELKPGSYFVAVILTDPKTGRRVGSGVYRQPLRIDE
jgi:hypothetical protein